MTRMTRAARTLWVRSKRFLGRQDRPAPSTRRARDILSARERASLRIRATLYRQDQGPITERP